MQGKVCTQAIGFPTATALVLQLAVQVFQLDFANIIAMQPFLLPWHYATSKYYID